MSCSQAITGCALAVSADAWSPVRFGYQPRYGSLQNLIEIFLFSSQLCGGFVNIRQLEDPLENVSIELGVDYARYTLLLSRWLRWKMFISAAGWPPSL